MKKSSQNGRILTAALIFCFIALSGTAMAVASKDGVFEGQYVNEKKGGVMKVEVEVKNGEIVACTMESYDAEGNLKDEYYGRDSGIENYRRAQNAVEGMKQYPKMLLETQDLDEMDAVSGATVSFAEFGLAVQDALKKGR